MGKPARHRDDLDWVQAGHFDHVLLARLDHVAVIQLNRPGSHNALSDQLMTDLVEQFEQLDRDSSVRVIVLCGSDRAFAAGADIHEMIDVSPLEMHQRPRLAHWHRLRRIKKPMIAAVNGFALGGGNELAMACDIIVAGESAVFGMPEVGLGLIPGGGGTQRLVRAIGKAQAMDMILSGRTLASREAADAGLVSRVVPDELCLAEAIDVSQIIADRPPYAVQMAKDAVLKAFDISIESGMDYERRLFELLFSSNDTHEGLQAFKQKRKPHFTGE